MTCLPFTVTAEETVAEAHLLMRRARIRHLPVLDGDKLVGLVSRSDLRLLETLHDVNPSEVTVQEAMSRAPYTATASVRLEQVCRVMAERRIGSTVVVSRGKPVGVFTTVDALRALAELASGKRNAAPRDA